MSNRNRNQAVLEGQLQGRKQDWEVIKERIRNITMEKQWMESGLTGKKLAKIKNREIFEQKEKQFCKRK